MPDNPTYEELKNRVQELETAESERKHLEKKLIQSYKLTGYIISHAGISIAVHDKNLNYLYVSNRYLEEYKVKDHNIIGKNHYEVFPDLPQKWRDVHQKSLIGEVLSAEEDPYYREDGSVDWTRWECRPWYEDSGSIGGIIVYTEVINDRRQIEEDLRKSELLLSTHLLNTPVGAISWDLDFKVLEWNPAAEKIFGYTKAETIGRNAAELIFHKEMREEIGSIFHDQLSGKGEDRITNENITKDGRRIICDWFNTTLKDTDGKVTGVASLVNDITEIKKAEEDLRERKATLDSILRAAPTGIGMVTDRVLTMVNDRFCEMVGYSREELINMKSRNLYPSEDEFNWVGEEKYKQISQKGTGTVETQMKKKGGDIIDVLLSSTPLDPADLLRGVTFTALDITDRKQVENKLKISEKTYREIFNGSNDVIFIHDIDSSAIVDVNSRAKGLYGYDPSDLYGMTFEFLSKGEPPFSVAEASEWIKKTIELGPQVFEWMARNKDGELFWVEVSLKKASIGGKDRLMSVVRDIRQRKAAEKKLKEYHEHLEELVEKRTSEIKNKNKELETFTYSVSHDLKAPLRGIDGYSRLLQEKYSDKLDEEGLFFLNNVRQGTTQMNKLIEDLLAYSRTERKELHHTSIDLKSLIENLIAQSHHDIEQCGINLKIEVPFQTIASDTETLRQVLTNYLDNAIKYSKKDVSGTIIIGGSQDDDYWTIWVKDNGIGFDSKYLDRIFEIFQRLHRVEEYPGTGVGLAIVRKAVERIGGRVRADSSPGEGSIFYLDIPKNKYITV